MNGPKENLFTSSPDYDDYFIKLWKETSRKDPTAAFCGVLARS